MTLSWKGIFRCQNG